MDLWCSANERQLTRAHKDSVVALSRRDTHVLFVRMTVLTPPENLIVDDVEMEAISRQEAQKMVDDEGGKSREIQPSVDFVLAARYGGTFVCLGLIRCSEEQ
jgi:hypothetical protein